MNHLPLEKAIILDAELKKAGVEIVTEFIWYPESILDEVTYPAPTLSEMIDLLPEGIVEELEYDLELYPYTTQEEQKWAVTYYYYGDGEDTDRELVTLTSPTLLEAVYEALLWCLREGYVVGKE